jgi:hypothetical protein
MATKDEDQRSTFAYRQEMDVDATGTGRREVWSPALMEILDLDLDSLVLVVCDLQLLQPFPT